MLPSILFIILCPNIFFSNFLQNDKDLNRLYFSLLRYHLTLLLEFFFIQFYNYIIFFVCLSIIQLLFHKSFPIYNTICYKRIENNV